MQNVSKKYKESMKSLNRNRGYIKATIGLVNSRAQNEIKLDKQTKTVEYSNDIAPFDGEEVTRIYATAEPGIAVLDGNTFFLPRTGTDYYNNGIVTADIMGTVTMVFANPQTIKGLTVNFGKCYPAEFDVITNNGTTRYRNADEVWITEDVFTDITFITIEPTQMRYGQNRLRIYSFKCGLAKTFTNEEVMDYSSKEYVSPIAETIPSMDVMIKVDNQDQYYDPDNPDSAIQYMGIGQEVKVQFGYDVDGQGNIEWLPGQTTYLSAWSANSREATFNATDRFTLLTGQYYKGQYYANGISLYDLALLVLADAGITDSSNYFLDNFLKNTVTHNPLPVATHAECLQIIANAGRCTLSIDRQNRIHIQSAITPTKTISSNGQLDFSDIDSVLHDDNGALTAKQYAMLRLTASRYDTYKLTAYEYATQAKFKLK